MKDTIRAVQWLDDELVLLDQRLLPGEEAYLPIRQASDAAEAIRNMVVRGAPAIGVTAAYAVVLGARAAFEKSPMSWREHIQADLDLLREARPTAVNLRWALGRMAACFEGIRDDPVPHLLEQARAIHEADITANYRMAELGSALIDGDAVLTHCNTGSLATGGYGTALGVIRTAYETGRTATVFADETRPWLQGARLTAWELEKDGIPVSLLCEGAAASLMRAGRVGWVIVGADRVAANGDVANKIGTYSLAVNARHHGVKFMVVAPISTLDLAIACGDDIPIEERAGEEVLRLYDGSRAPGNAWNPVFDITPAALVDALVTERGVVLNPDTRKILALLSGN